MKIESCRKCGNERKVIQNCNICEEAIKFSCIKCNYESEEQIHTVCRLVDMNKKPVVLEAA